MSAIRFRDMWFCIAIWIAMDILMMAWGSLLPEWMRFDGRDALHRDLWVVGFIIWVWICFAFPSDQ